MEVNALSSIVHISDDHQRRYLSQQSSKVQKTSIPTSIVRPNSITPRTSIYESPKKIHFTYQPSPSRCTSQSYYERNSSPITPVHQNNSFKMPQQIFSASKTTNSSILSPQTNFHETNVPFLGRMSLKTPGMPGNNFNNNIINEIIDRKIRAG